MTYGTPTGPDNVADFYTDVRRGHPPTNAQLADLERRYNAIGGLSPLRERTNAQLRALQMALDQRAPGEFVTFYGAKHAHPKIENTIDEIAEQGITQLVGLVLAPHYSALSVGEYIDRARQRADERGLRCSFIERWGADEQLISLLATRIEEATKTIVDKAENIEFVFTAHSLPARILDQGDHYADELAETAELVKKRLGLAHYRCGWQSAGRTAEPWLGPDLLSLLEIIKAESYDAVVVCAAGFTSDHLEVLYDLDVEAAGRARELGLGFARTRSLNDDRVMSELLARRIVVAHSQMGD
jgi:ferrochelatase